MGSHSRSFVKGLIFSLLTFSFSAEAEIYVYPNKFKTAEELKEVVRSALQDEGQVKVVNSQLEIDASAEKLEEIKVLLSEIDKGARQLTIQVSSGKTAGSEIKKTSVFEGKESFVSTEEGSFSTVVRVTGDIVVMDIYQFVSREKKNGISHSYKTLTHSLHGQIGQWIDLGHLITSKNESAVKVQLVK